MVIVGIAGTDGAGKGTVVSYLINHYRFVHYSTRKILVEKLRQRGEPIDRAHMRFIANTLRKEHGNDYVVQEFLSRARAAGDEHIVLESLRAVAEVEALHAAGGMLFVVDADQQLRYQRAQVRGSASDAVSFEEFVAHEALEMNDPDPHGLQKAAVMGMADYSLRNDTTLEALHGAIDEVMKHIVD